MRNLIVSVILLLALGACHDTDDHLALTPAERQYAQEHVIKVGMETDFPPFSYVGPGAQRAGIGIQVLDRIAEHAHLKLKYLYFGTYGDMLAAFKRGELDVIAAMHPSPEVIPVVNMTEPYVITSSIMLLHELPVQFPLRVGFSPEHFGRERLHTLERVASIQPVPSDHQAFRLMLSDVVDATLLSGPSAFWLQQTYKKTFKSLTVDAPYTVSLGFQPSNQLLGNILQLGVEHINATERAEARIQ